MMNKEHLNWITGYLRDNVWINDDIMFFDPDYADKEVEILVDIVSSLHNELYKAVTGDYYDYCFHWANKIGAGYPEDKLFTDDPVEREKLLKRLAEGDDEDA